MVLATTRQKKFNADPLHWVQLCLHSLGKASCFDANIMIYAFQFPANEPGKEGGNSCCAFNTDIALIFLSAPPPI